MSTDDLQLRYEQVCDRLAESLQTILRLDLQVFRLKQELASTEDFVDRMVNANPTWEIHRLDEPPHHIQAE